MDTYKPRVFVSPYLHSSIFDFDAAVEAIVGNVVAAAAVDGVVGFAAAVVVDVALHSVVAVVVVLHWKWGQDF